MLQSVSVDFIVLQLNQFWHVSTAHVIRKIKKQKYHVAYSSCWRLTPLVCFGTLLQNIMPQFSTMLMFSVCHLSKFTVANLFPCIFLLLINIHIHVHGKGLMDKLELCFSQASWQEWIPRMFLPPCCPTSGTHIITLTTHAYNAIAPV